MKPHTLTLIGLFILGLAASTALAAEPAAPAKSPAVAPLPAPEPPGKPETYRPPQGIYQHLWLDFAGADWPARWVFGKNPPQPFIGQRAFVGLRDGASTTAWFLNGAVPGGKEPAGAYKVKIDRHDLKLTADALRGTIALRQVSTWQPIRLAMITIQIDAKRNGAELTGTWTAQVAEGATTNGTLTAKLTDQTALRTGQPFAAGADWPTYYGPYDGNRASAAGAAILDDLTQAKPLWRSEEALGAGWGCGSPRPYQLVMAGPCGGASSPVFAGGRIFQFHFVPSGQVDTGLVDRTLGPIAGLTPMEKDIITTGLRPLADTILTCIDPQTGATLWRTTVPRLSFNYQAHKWRGMNPTPTVIGNVVVVSDYGFNHLGLKADTGEVLWTIRGSQRVVENYAPVRPVAAAGLAILDGGTAVNPATGEVVWKTPVTGEILPWSSGGVDRLIVIGQRHWNIRASEQILCLEAATGKQLWAQPLVLIAGFGSVARIGGDTLVGFAPAEDPKLKGHGKPQAWKLSATGMKKIWEDEILPPDENMTVSFGTDRVYVQGKEEVRAIELTTGKRLATAKGKEAFPEVFPGLHGPSSNPWLCVIGDRILLNPEGQHGKTGFLLMDRDLKPLGVWHPSHNPDSAYAYMAMISPVVDGRIFIRGNDGLYCYDLRKRD